MTKIYVLYREPKDLEEYAEEEEIILEKMVEISQETRPIDHLVSFFKRFGKEEFELEDSFSKYINLKFLFYEDLKPRQKEELLKDLFLDFLRKGLYGRSKERTKLILLLDLTTLGYGIALIQTSITGKEIKILQTESGEILVADDRFLDEHNIYRFVYFYTKDSKIFFKAHQKSYSRHFVEWLQIAEEKGIDITQELDFSFLCQYGKLTLQINLSEDILMDIVDKGSQHDIVLDTSKGELIIDPVRFKIVKIKVKGTRKEFKDINSFLRYLKDRKFNIDLIRNAYLRALKRLEKQEKRDLRIVPLVSYDEEYVKKVPIIEDETSVIVGNTKINKKLAILPHSLALLIVSDHPATLFKPEFLSEISLALRKGKTVRILTIHEPIADFPLSVGSIELYNLIPEISEALKEISMFYKKEISNLPTTLKELLVAIILDFLSKEIKSLRFFFRQLLENYLEIPLFGKILYFESNLIEYKRADIFYGKKEKVIRRLQEEIVKKLKSRVVVFVIGIDGDTREICPLDPGKVNDDLIREILNDVKKRLEPSGITLSEPYPVPTSSSGWLLVFYAEQVGDESKEISLPDLA